MPNTLMMMLRALSICAGIFLPAQALAAYTCSNPAICIAVCGERTCGRIAATDPDMRALQAYSPSAPGQIANSRNASVRNPYTCSNEAICIAVCGKKTC